jgi:hypothetical protein
MVFQHSVLPPLHARAGEKAMRLRRKARWFKLGWGIGRLIGGMHHTYEASHPTVVPTAERCPHASVTSGPRAGRENEEHWDEHWH